MCSSDLPAGFPANNPVDHFLAENIVAYQAQARSAKIGGVDFYAKVFPILEASCLECHQGGKAKGGLHLDSRAGALKGGKSDGAAIVPGDPARSPLLARIRSQDPDEMMPPKGHRLAAADVAIVGIVGSAESDDGAVHLAVDQSAQIGRAHV